MILDDLVKVSKATIKRLEEASLRGTLESVDKIALPMKGKSQRSVRKIRIDNLRDDDIVIGVSGKVAITRG